MSAPEIRSVVEDAETMTFEVALPGPLDAPASLEMFRRSGDDLMDRWDGVRLLRTLDVGGRAVPFACVSVGALESPALRAEVERPSDRDAVESAIRVMFGHAPDEEYAALLLADPVVAAVDARYPGMRPVRQFDLLSALVRCISAQQVNLRWATTTRRRLAETFGERLTLGSHEVYSLNAERLAALEVADMRALQFTTRKAEYLIGAAREIASGALDLATLDALPDEAVIERLVALRGIGRWSAEWILARTLGRPCVVAGDLAVRKVVARAYLGHVKGEPLPDEAAIRRATAHWGASAAVVQGLLLHGYGQDGAIT